MIAPKSSINIITQIWICGFILISIQKSCKASWGTPGLGQYHIQTDEGPERYFRYQTDSGQYRKEKRLQDGTVIGTDAWIDASGYLRQKDYIADHQGYRILKSKTVFVGQGRSIEEAIKSTKNLPANAGKLINRGYQSSPTTYNSPSPSTYYSSPQQTTSSNYPTTKSPYYSTRLQPTNYLGYDHYPTPQQVYIRPHSQPVDNNVYTTSVDGSTTAKNVIPLSSDYPSSLSTSTESPLRTPSRIFEPPYDDKAVRPIGIASTTPAPITANYGLPIAATYPSSSSTALTPISSTPPSSSSSSSGVYSSTPAYVSSTFSPIQYSTTNRPDIYSTPISSSTYHPNTIESSTPRPVIPLSNNNLEVQPLYTRPPAGQSAYPYRYYAQAGQAPLQYNNHLGSGYDRQYSLYDGVSVTNDGFRYYLPRQYHEEETIDGQTKAGSFGYIDPFGIRRVIYYNASPGQGFVHRKNNRYVGFNATPYDPRPL